MLFKLRHWNIAFFIALLLALVSTTTCAAITDKAVQIDLLMSKITSLIEAKQEAKALPYFSQLEAIETPLPESFYYFYIDALDKSGDSKKALSRSEIYLNAYGKKGKYYSSVLTIYARLSIQVGQETTEQSVLTEFKNASIIEFRNLQTEFARFGSPVQFTYLDGANESDIKRLITRLTESASAYDKLVMSPSIDRLQFLLKKREMLVAGEQRDHLDEEIKRVNEDIGLVANLNYDFLSGIYSALEKFRFLSDSRIIENVRLRSYLYSRCDGKSIKFLFNEIEDRVAVHNAKFVVEMSDW